MDLGELAEEEECRVPAEETKGKYMGPFLEQSRKIKEQRGSLYQDEGSYVTLIDHASLISRPRYAQPPSRGMAAINETQEEHYRKAPEVPADNVMLAVDKLVHGYNGKVAGYRN